VKGRPFSLIGGKRGDLLLAKEKKGNDAIYPSFRRGKRQKKVKHKKGSGKKPLLSFTGPKSPSREKKKDGENNQVFLSMVN